MQIHICMYMGRNRMPHLADPIPTLGVPVEPAPQAYLGCGWGVCSGRSRSEVDDGVARCGSKVWSRGRSELRPERGALGSEFDDHRCFRPGLGRANLVWVSEPFWPREESISSHSEP